MFDSINTSKRPALVIFGANSSGKSSLIQRFLDIGNILPVGIGPVTARIVQLSYAPADKAGFRIYLTVEKTEIESEGDLSSFFADPAKPDWKGIAQALLPHVRRPSETEVNLAQFNEWAARFIEVRLPSKVLEWGIDVYDTPGFLSDNRDEALNKNLYALVKRIQPTLLFLYENAAINETEQNCFLAMKKALDNLAPVPIFFLATKADCGSIANDYSLDDDPEQVSDDMFKEALGKKRQRCYELLRLRKEMANEVLGSLPDQVDECSCFDIFTTPQKFDPWRNFTQPIATHSIRRIVQFTVDSFSMPIRAVTRDMLDRVANYFDLMDSTTQRTAEQWGKLRQEAFDWGERFFSEFAGSIPTLIDELLERIRRLIEEHQGEIVRQAADLERPGDPFEHILTDKRKRIRDYVRLAVQEKIIKVATNQVISEQSKKIMTDMTPHFEQQRRVRGNELLVIAQRQTLAEIRAGVLGDKSRFAFFLDNLLKLPMIIGRFSRSIPVRLSDATRNSYNEFIQDQISSNADASTNLMDDMDAYGKLLNADGRRSFAAVFLTATANALQRQKNQYVSNLAEWIEKKRRAFRANIQKNYKYISAHFAEPFALHDRLNPYSASFARIECQLLAALELAERKGRRPVLGEQLGRGGFYSVHAAQWGSERDLAVKRLHNPSPEHLEMMTFEVHYHRAVSGFEHIAPFRYVYEHDLPGDHRELWLIMPRYPLSLQEYLKRNMPKVTFERSISFAVTIAEALSELHRCEFVHRDLKTSNIMLDANEQCQLIDFGTAKSGLLNHTVLGTAPIAPEILTVNKKRPNDVHHYDGTAVDVYSFGCILYEIFPKATYDRLTVNTVPLIDKLFLSTKSCNERTKDYECLTKTCLATDPVKRPRIGELVSRLKAIQQQLEAKLCVACDDKERTIRFKPCGHKVMCDDCWQSWSNEDRSEDKCILCKVIVTGESRDDINATFYAGKT